MSVFLFLCGLVGVVVGVIALFRPIQSLRIHRRSTAAAVLLLGIILFILGALWDSTYPRWVSFFIALSVVGIPVGLLNLVRPIHGWRITKRKTGGIILGGSFLLLVAAMAGSPQQPVRTQTAVNQETAVPAADTTAIPAGAAPAAPVPVAVTTPQAPVTPTEPAPVSTQAPAGTTSTPARDAAEATPVAPAGLEEVQVVRVVDGDTIEVQTASGQNLKVRLIGVDTPETVHPSKPVQPYGPEASAYTKQRLSGQSVRLEYDVEHTDHYGRTLAYVWLAQELFNAALVREGYGQLMTIPPNVKYVDQFRQLQTAAREANRGMWGIGVQPAEAAETPSAPAPAPTPVPAPKPAPSPKPAPAAPPAPAPKSGRFAPSGGQCVANGVEYFKGNRSSMIYHSPTGQFYDKTNAEDCFYTAGDAEAAGYRASKR